MTLLRCCTLFKCATRSDTEMYNNYKYIICNAVEFANLQAQIQCVLDKIDNEQARRGGFVYRWRHSS